MQIEHVRRSGDGANLSGQHAQCDDRRDHHGDDLDRPTAPVSDHRCQNRNENDNRNQDDPTAA